MLCLCLFGCESQEEWKEGRAKRMKTWTEFQHGADADREGPKKRQKLYGFDIKMPEARDNTTGCLFFYLFFYPRIFSF